MDDDNSWDFECMTTPISHLCLNSPTNGRGLRIRRTSVLASQDKVKAVADGRSTVSLASITCCLSGYAASRISRIFISFTNESHLCVTRVIARANLTQAVATQEPAEDLNFALEE